MSETTDDRSDGSADRPRRRPAAGRARKRAIRARASQAGVPYVIAARHLESGLEAPASRGRTVYPDSSDEHRRWLIAPREQRSYDVRVRDTRRAIVLPLGRARHLVERFPSLRGEPGTGVGRLYDGEARPVALGMLYATAVHERPDLVPTVDELAWLAELGEETAVDLACTRLDRAVRDLLDRDRWSMWTRIDAALAAAEHDPDRQRRNAARELAWGLRSLAARSSMDGARHTLDALLVVEAGGHAPGTRARILIRPYRGQTATIVGVRWDRMGPPSGYDVTPDGGSVVVSALPGQLTLLEQRETRVPV